MNPSVDRGVTIEERGRSGSVHYREPAGGLSFYWELGGGDTVAIIQVEDAAAWKARSPGIAGRRAEILRFVADEVIRQKAPGSRARIDEEAGCITLHQAARPAQPAPAAPPREFSMSTWRSLQLKLALVVLAVAVAGAAAWLFKSRVLVIESSTGTPFGSSVRADERIATLIQALEPYTPSLHRDASKDRYRMGLHVVPVDGSSAGRLIPIVGDQPISSFRLAKILGSDGRTLWFDVNGIGGVDLRTYKRVTAADLRRANPSLAAHWWEDTRGMEVDGRLRLASRDRQEVLEVDPATLKAAPVAAPQRSSRPPFAPTPAALLGAGLYTAPTEWLGLHSPAEMEREFKPSSWLRRVVRAEETRELRRFHRGVLDPDAGGARNRIVSMTPLGSDAYLNAAFLRADDRSEPLRLSNPDGALMAYTSAPGLNGTLMVARVDLTGKVVWKADTGIDRFKLSQILPGDPFMAFVGTRPAVPDKVPEPLLVIVDNRTGKVAASTLWQ